MDRWKWQRRFVFVMAALWLTVGFGVPMPWVAVPEDHRLSTALGLAYLALGRTLWPDERKG
jgi:hypothetical protein